MIMKPSQYDAINQASAKESNSKDFTFLQNDWKHAFETNNDEIETVEVPLKSKGLFGFSSPSSREKWKNTGNKEYLRSISRLVILKDKETGSVKSFIMTIMADTDYLEKNNFRYKSITYLERGDDFNGALFFHSLKGDFINGWRIGKGIVTGKIKEGVLSHNKFAKTASLVCETYEVYEYFEQCTDWYNSYEEEDDSYSGYSGTSCETYEEYVGTYEVCEDDGIDETDPYVDEEEQELGGDGTSGSDIVIYSPEIPIYNITDYLKCFDTNQSAQIKIYVDQPVHGSSSAHSGLDAGHSFISITQGNITRYFGHYPEGTAMPKINEHSPHVYGNDEGHEYDIVIDYSIDFSTLTDVIDFVANYDVDYDLDTNNCTDFAIQFMNETGISNVPDPQCSWSGGGNGSCPGAFGESLKTWSLPSGVTRTVPTTATKAGFNQVNCN